MSWGGMWVVVITDNCTNCFCYLALNHHTSYTEIKEFKWKIFREYHFPSSWQRLNPRPILRLNELFF
jgi:hypothetical protein